MMKIVDYFINRPKIANLVLFFIFLMGFISMVRTQNEGYPQVDFGVVNITTLYPGASPADVELKITNKIEEELIGIDGIDYINSASIENLSQIGIILEEDADYDEVVSDIQKAVDQVDDLPSDIKNRPVVTEINNDRFPVIEVAISGSAPYRLQRQYAVALEKQLRGHPLVGKVEKLGYFKREIKIEAAQSELSRQYVSLSEIISAVQQRNIRITGGDLTAPDEEKKLVVLSEFEQAIDVKEAIVRSGFDGNRVVISDIANVTDSYEKPEKIIRYNGKRAIHLLALKKTTSDIVHTSNAIKQIVADFNKTTPPTIQADIVVDYSTDVKNLLDLVVSNAKIGLVLVGIALILFLNLRVAFWTALGIPISVFVAFILFPIFGVTINFITLMAIIIVLGMLVDDAIVVSENIFRYREQGMDAKEAAIKGTREVMWPVISTVLTTIVAFSPLLVMGGVFGKFMWGMPVVISLILLGSLGECLFLLPSHIAHARMPKKSTSQRRVMPILEDHYERIVLITMRFRWVTLAVFVLAFVSSIVLLVTSMRFILFESEDGLIGVVRAETPRGTAIEETERRMAKIEDILSQVSKEEVTGYLTTVGQKTPVIEQVGLEINHGGVANIVMHFTPMGERERKAPEIMKEIHDKIQTQPGFEKIEATVVKDGPPIGKAITVTLISNDDEARNRVAGQMMDFLNQQPGTKHLETNEGEGKRQAMIRFDYDKMARLGITPSQAAMTIRSAYDGVIATTLREGGEEVDFRVSLGPEARQTTDTLLGLTVPNNRGKLIPVGQFINLTQSDDILMINHYDGDRSVTVYGGIDTEQNSSAAVNQLIQEKFQPIVNQYPDMRMVFGGEEKDTQESMQSLYIAMALSLTGIYFILVVLFNSFSQPFLVMSCIPFTFTGIVYAFYIHNMPFSFVALIGLIGLTGIVVNNSLIMISFMNQSRDAHGLELPNLASAARRRLRPILLTTATTAAGLFPTAYGFGGENPILIPMIMAIAWGLIFATVITLFLIPSLYVMQANGFKVLRTIPARLAKIRMG